MSDYTAEYLALREANNRWREGGLAWLWQKVEAIAAEKIDPPLELGRQEAEFMVAASTMIGERIGVRCQFRTMLFDVGWPRLPEHGFVPGNGLARGRISLSQNLMLDAQPIAELILRRSAGDAPPVWHLIRDERPGEPFTLPLLRQYLDLLRSGK